MVTNRGVGSRQTTSSRRTFIGSVAASVASANGASLTSCEVVSGEVRVVAQVRWSGPWRRAMALLADVPGIEAGARAGLR